jgi:hypothetical protein
MTSQRCILLAAMTGFLDFVNRLEFYIIENTTLRKVDLFPSPGEMMGDTYFVRSLTDS